LILLSSCSLSPPYSHFFLQLINLQLYCQIQPPVSCP